MSYQPPTAEQQIEFLAKIQRLLSEGGGKFTATYKFALLKALADLAVEKGEDTGRSFRLEIKDIAEKFIEYYWPQARPFPAAKGKPSILSQNTDRQAAIVSWLAGAGNGSSQSLYSLKNDIRSWNSLVNKIARQVVKMPLWRLQTIGKEDHVFLYENKRDDKSVTAIVLRPGVMYNLRRFHELLVDLINARWILFVRGIGNNPSIIGESHDLHGFMFGTDRQVLKAYNSFLPKMQDNRCFYCKGALSRSCEIDHFVPWSRYPLDLGHNFVAAHQTCNNSKRDYLASERFLERWITRNEKCRDFLLENYDRHNLIHNEGNSLSITGWAYEQVHKTQSHVWDGKGQIVKLLPTWKRLLDSGESQTYLVAADKGRSDEFKFIC